MRGFTQHSVQKQEKGELRSVAPQGKQVRVEPQVKDAIRKKQFVFGMCVIALIDP